MDRSLRGNRLHGKRPGPRSLSEKCVFLWCLKQNRSIMSYEQELPTVPTGSGVSASPQHTGLAPGEPSLLLRQLLDRSYGPFPPLLRIWRRTTRPTAQQPSYVYESVG